MKKNQIIKMEKEKLKTLKDFNEDGNSPLFTKDKMKIRDNLFYVIAFVIVVGGIIVSAYFITEGTNQEMGDSIDFYVRELPNLESDDWIESYDFVCEEGIDSKVCLYKIKGGQN